MDEILLLGAFDSDNSNIDDAFAIHNFLNNENLGHRAELYGQFDFENMLNIECRNCFRFEKEEINRLATALGLPETITSVDRVAVNRKYPIGLQIKEEFINKFQFLSYTSR